MSEKLREKVEQERGERGSEREKAIFILYLVAMLSQSESTKSHQSVSWPSAHCTVHTLSLLILESNLWDKVGGKGYNINVYVDI